jgi:ABC-2 type transport system permease protein
MIILPVMKKLFLEFSRNRISVVILILFPLFFLFIFKMAFGTADISGVSTYNITIVNNDLGIPEPLKGVLPSNITNWSDTGVGQNLTDILLGLQYNDSGHTPIFNQVENTNITESLKNGDISMALIIPENYSLMVLDLINIVYGNQSIPGFPTTVNATIEFRFDSNNVGVNIPITIAKQTIETFHQAIVSGRLPQVIQIEQKSIIRSEVNSIFDFIASGLLVFASILSASFFSAQLLSDEEQGTISRINLSIITPLEYMLGFILMTLTLVILQNIILLYSAVYIFGFNPVGSLFRGYVILLLSALPMFALVFTAGALFKSSDTAGNAIGFSSSILGFASNAFFQMPDVVLIPDILSFTSGSPDLLIWDLIPWNHAVNAMRAIMLYDHTLSDQWGDLIMLVATSLMWLAISIWFFGKKTFRLED